MTDQQKTWYRELHQAVVAMRSAQKKPRKTRSTNDDQREKKDAGCS